MSCFCCNTKTLCKYHLDTLVIELVERNQRISARCRQYALISNQQQSARLPQFLQLSHFAAEKTCQGYITGATEITSMHVGAHHYESLSECTVLNITKYLFFLKLLASVCKRDKTMVRYVASTISYLLSHLQTSHITDTHWVGRRHWRSQVRVSSVSPF